MKKNQFLFPTKSKKNSFLTLALSGCFLLSGCVSDPDYVDHPSGGLSTLPTDNPMPDLDIQNGFDWATIRTVKLNLSANDIYQGEYEYLMDVWDNNPLHNEEANLLAQGVAKAGTPYTVSISVPTGVNSLFIRQTDPRKRSVIRKYTLTADNTLTVDFGTSSSGKRNLGLRAEEDPEFPVYASVPDNAVEIRDQNAKPNPTHALQNGGIYKITGTYTGTFTHWGVGHAQLFVEGTWTLDNPRFKIETGLEIIVLPGAKIVAGDLELVGTSRLNLQKDGTVEIRTLTCSNDNKLYNAGSFKAEKLHNNPGLIYNGESGKMEVTDFKPGGSTIYNYGIIQCKQVESTWGLTWYNNCKIDVEEDFAFKEGVLKMEQGTVQARTMQFNGNTIYLNNGSLLSATQKIAMNSNTRFNGGSSENRSLLQAPVFSFASNIVFEGNLTVEVDEYPAGNPWWSPYELVPPAEITGYQQSAVQIVTCDGTIHEGNPGDSIGQITWPLVYTDSTVYSYAFEDNWPVYGDHDMNDVVLYLTSRQYTKQESGLITAYRISGKLMAVGAAKKIAAALQLAGVEASQVSAVTFGHTGVGADLDFFELTSANIESGQPYAVVPLFSNAHDFITGQNQASGLINTIVNSQNVEPREFEIALSFAEGVEESQLDVRNLDLFIITDGNNKNRAEVHLPTFGPTNKANPAYVGTGNCVGSSAPYLSSEGLSFGLIIPYEFQWPVESVAITKVYSGFAPWAQSSGVNNSDWYRGNRIEGTDPVQYETPSNVFKFK